MAHLRAPDPPWVEIAAWVRRVTRLTLTEHRLGSELAENLAHE